MVEQVRHYKLARSGFAEAERQCRRRYLIPQLSIIIAFVLLSSVLGAWKAESTGFVVFFAVFAGLFITYACFVSPRRMRRRLTALWDTYVLEVGPDYLLRQQADTSDVRLGFREIRKIEHLPGRYLRVFGSTKHHVIGIPESLEHFDEVLATLSPLAPIETPRRDSSLKGSLLTALGFGAYMAMLWSRSPAIVLPLAVLVMGLLIWLISYMWRNPNVSRRNKRMAWLYVIFLIICGFKVLEIVGELVRP